MLESLIHQEIQENGPLSQQRFMELALCHPKYGYYCSQQTIAQDFVTAPEISQVFGELIGLWALDFYLKLNSPKNLSLIELGPGKGTLMADLLRASSIMPAFKESLTLYLLERSSLLKASQEKTIPFPKTWIENLADIPRSSFPFIGIANEFFDALPTDCFVRKNNQLYKRVVDSRNGQLEFKLEPLQSNSGPDQIWEESPQADFFMEKICQMLLNQGGIFLIIDYGYEEGQGDSFQALYKGEPSDPLAHVGQSDLTCHVHFGRLKEIALTQGCSVAGPITQGKFLKNIGIETRLEMLKQSNPSEKHLIEVAGLRLTHPQHMGTLFNVMAVYSPSSLVPTGFYS